MNSELTEHIEQAIKGLAINAHQIDRQSAAEVSDQVMRRFVVGTPRAWWMSLAVPTETRSSSDYRLLDVLPEQQGRCWFILETEEKHLPVFDIDVKDVAAVLGECPFFEYYVVGRNYDWLVAESDHNMFFICRADDGTGLR